MQRARISSSRVALRKVVRRRFPALVAELIQLQVRLPRSRPVPGAVQAMGWATGTIPIVMLDTGSENPYVRIDYLTSAPRCSITGVIDISVEIT